MAASPIRPYALVMGGAPLGYRGYHDMPKVIPKVSGGKGRLTFPFTSCLTMPRSLAVPVVLDQLTIHVRRLETLGIIAQQYESLREERITLQRHF